MCIFCFKLQQTLHILCNTKVAPWNSKLLECLSYEIAISDHNLVVGKKKKKKQRAGNQRNSVSKRSTRLPCIGVRDTCWTICRIKWVGKSGGRRELLNKMKKHSKMFVATWLTYLFKHATKRGNWNLDMRYYFLVYIV